MHECESCGYDFVSTQGSDAVVKLGVSFAAVIIEFDLDCWWSL